VEHGRGDILIERHTPLPARATGVYTTAADGQTEAEVHVLQEQRDEPDGYRSLGRLHVDDLRPAPAGETQIEVTLDVDVRGPLSVSARSGDQPQEAVSPRLLGDDAIVGEGRHRPEVDGAFRRHLLAVPASARP
jgi:molecular chaperone DnaK (HSP70)